MKQVETKNAILELLLAKKPIVKIQIVKKDYPDRKTKKILSVCRKRNIPVEIISKQFFKKKSRLNFSEEIIGFIAEGNIEKTTLDEIIDRGFERGRLTILIFREIQYEMNLAVILRTAYGFRVDALIVPSIKGRGSDAEILRSSMGASEIVPVIRMSVLDALSKLKKAGVLVVGADMHGDHNLSDVSFGDMCAVVFGGESLGLPDGMKDRCDVLAKIPLFSKLESFNINVSVGIFLYERTKKLILQSK